MSTAAEINFSMREISADELIRVIRELNDQVPGLYESDPDTIAMTVEVEDAGNTLNEPGFFRLAAEYEYHTAEAVTELLSTLTTLNEARLEPPRFDDDLEFGASAAVYFCFQDERHLPTYGAFLAHVDFDHAHAHIGIIEALAERWGNDAVAVALGPHLQEAELIVDAFPWLLAGDSILSALRDTDSSSREAALADLAEFDLEDLSSSDVEARCVAAKESVLREPAITAAGLESLVRFLAQDHSFLRSNAEYYLYPALGIAARRSPAELSKLLDLAAERGMKTQSIATALLLQLESAHKAGDDAGIIAELRNHAHRLDEREREVLLSEEAIRVIKDTLDGDTIEDAALPSLIALVDEIGEIELSDAFASKSIIEAVKHLCRERDGERLAKGLRVASKLRFSGEALAPPSYLTIEPKHFYDFLTSTLPTTEAVDLAKRLQVHLRSQSDEGWRVDTLDQAIEALSR